MEVGAVKQAFNNEVILLKKKLNQAKIQIIHKLTRKAKQLVEKKCPEPLKEKLKRKAESAVNEVLILKKIKPKDLAQFIVTHKGELKDFLNKPTVNNEKACARLLLHKALQDKYKFIRSRFSNVPIQDLFMSRVERRKMKKEAKEKQKNKKKGKEDKIVNSAGDWNVEEVDVTGQSNLSGDEMSDADKDLDHKDSKSGDENDSGEEDNNSNAESEFDSIDEDVIEEKQDLVVSEDGQDNSVESDENNSDSEIKEVAKAISLSPKAKAVEKPHLVIKPKEIIKKKPEKKQKDINKNKNLKEKLHQRTFKKNADTPVVGNKIVDPFFITSTGDNYLSVVEPRGPDEVKAEHKQGNRKLRRAVMFGHVPKPKPRENNNYHRDNNERFNNRNNYETRDNFRNNRQEFNNRKSNDFNDRKQFNDRKTNDFNDRKRFNDRQANDFNGRNRFNDKSNDEKPEKLHPSWEAKKKKSGILPFEGKKIVFD